MTDNMLKKLKMACDMLENKYEDGEAVDDKGNKIPILIIHHGVHTLIALDRVNHILLLYRMDFEVDDAEKLDKLPEETKKELFLIIHREMLEGRTGYTISFDNNKKLQRITLEQKLIIDNVQGQTLQRIADGIQEIVVIAVRCQLILGQALSFEKSEGTGTLPPPPKGMYG